ncbi:unnamed protein product [Moneuplotes crassus]|uniref:Uncharacterized protein n=1 Tax=Euplotes crassus TaxID=5936 RepID=A0AAD2D837_EUPCR|nr:unnamed protein product [Moneuplotes crassus]
MIDDFDFEDDIGDLQDDSFEPTGGPKASKHGQIKGEFGAGGSSQSGLPPVKSKQPEVAFPKASGNFGIDNDSDEGDDFGLEEIGNKNKGQDMNPDGFSKGLANDYPIEESNISKKDDDYDINFDEYNESFKDDASYLNNNLNKPPIPKNVNTNSGLSQAIENKARPEKNSGIDIDGMRRLNDKLDNSSDFGEYEDDLSNLNMVDSLPKKQETPLQKIDTPVLKHETSPRKPETPIESFSTPPRRIPSIPKPRAPVIPTQNKPITDRTGPIAGPFPESQNLRLDTNERERIGIKKLIQEPSEESDYNSDKAEKDAFITQPLKNNDSEEGSRFNQDTESVPTQPKFEKSSVTSTIQAVDEDLDALHDENAHLISQITEFTEQMDQRMELLWKVKKVDQQIDRPNSAINSKKAKLDAMFKKMKLIKNDIQNMNKILDNSYRTDSLVDHENKEKEQQKILNEQKLVLKDHNKVIKEQLKFIKEAEQVEDADGKASQVNSTFDKFKNQLKEMKKKFTEDDKILRNRHEEVQIMKDRSRKIKDIIQEKKKIEAETGVKQGVSEDDISMVEGNIEKLEAERKDINKQWRKRIQLQEDRVIRMKHESNQMELKHKEKENELRMITLKIKELKRTIQSTYVNKATDNGRIGRNKSARSATNTSKDTPKSKKQNFRPNSSKRGGLQEAIRQEYKVEDGELNEPLPENTVKGVDFGGGNDSSFNDYQTDFDRTMEHTEPKNQVTSSVQIERQTSKPIIMPEEKEYYSKRANKLMTERLNISQNTDNQIDIQHQSNDRYSNQMSKPNLGQRSKPNLGKMMTKPMLGKNQAN